MSRWSTLTLLCLSLALPGVSLAQSAPPGYYPDGSAVYGDMGAYGYSRQKTKSKSRSYGPNGPLPAGPGRTIYEQLPDDQGWLYEDSPLERALKNAFRHAYFRTEYLLWDISDPGDNILGAPTNLTLASNNSILPIPVSEVPAFFLTDQNGNQIVAVQPSLDKVFTNENNGIRMTFGLNSTEAGTFEASVFALQSSTSRMGFPDYRNLDLDGDGVVDVSGLTPIDTNGDGLLDNFSSSNIVDAVAQAVLIDGQLPAGDNFLLVNDLDYQSSLKTKLWGSEANFLFAPFNPNSPLVTMPFIGFRYLNFSEDLRQSGLYTFNDFDFTTGLPTSQVVSRKIDSTTINNVYGPQIGLRAELRSKWFVLGAQPKVMMGLNSYRAELSTVQVLGPNDPSQSLYEKNTTFGIVGDLEVYSRLNLGDHLSAFVAYNFLWTGLITRPADNIVYNIQSATGGQPQQSDFGLDIDFSGAILQGISVGAQLEY